MSSLEALFGLKGKVALVTGASGGLGVEFAKGMAIAGADVAILARRKDRLQATAKEIEAMGVRCLPVVADVGDEAQLDRAVQEVLQAFGRIDVLVNNAGVADVSKPETEKREVWEHTLHINLTAPFLLCQRVARDMIARGEGGRIINIGSVTCVVANSIMPTIAYTASKGGVAMLTKQLAVEWAQHKITVNSIAPGWVPTDMNRDPRFGDIKPAYKERMEALTPLHRLGAEGDLMGALIYLASPAASYVTGSVLIVDGGWSAW